VKRIHLLKTFHSSIRGGGASPTVRFCFVYARAASSEAFQSHGRHYTFFFPLSELSLSISSNKLSRSAFAKPSSLRLDAFGLLARHVLRDPHLAEQAERGAVLQAHLHVASSRRAGKITKQIRVSGSLRWQVGSYETRRHPQRTTDARFNPPGKTQTHTLN
jgi:hypothetical protein